MNGNFNMPNTLLLEKRRRRRRIRRVKIIVRYAVMGILVFGMIFTAIKAVRFINSPHISETLNINKGKLNVKTLEVPDYVTVDLIHKGDARSGKKIDKINDIVIHYTGNPGSSAKNNRDYFDKSSTSVCSHFVVGINGEIIQCVPLNEKSAASNNRNSDTISIEVCHEEQDGKFSDLAYNSLIKLTAWLLDNSSLDETHIIRHYDVTGKICPAYYVNFPKEWERLKKDVKEQLSEI